ncbi:hypothetical protein LXL04_028177 [Taraxacum kok-saghyz]
MKKQTTIHGFYKRKYTSSQNPENPAEIVLDENASPSIIPDSSPIPTPSPIPAPSTIPAGESQPEKTCTEINEVDLSTLERDPGLRTQIYDYPVNHRDTVRRAYMTLGPLQSSLSVYPKSGPESHKCSFQECWFKLYPWLEYSKTLDDAFCFPCFLFNKPLGTGYYGQRAFTIDGFRNWNKVTGKKCALLHHMGTKCTSFYNVAQKAYDDLLSEARDIRNMFEKFTDKDCKNNRLRLMEAFGTFNPKMKELFRTAPKHALYTSPLIQKEILNLISIRVRRMICEEIDGGKFCLLV